jgi:hypothetical protein
MRIAAEKSVRRRKWRRPKCEQFLRLDVRTLDRDQTRQRDILTWVRLSKAGSLVLARARIGERLLRLNWVNSALGSTFSHQIRLDRTPCHYGGYRLWFLCPQCASRRAVLYGFAGDGQFGCWGCLDLVYASQDERKICRLWRRQAMIESKLKGGWRRPRYMHRRTFAKLSKQRDTVIEKQNRLFCTGARRLMRRRGWLHTS